MKLVFRQYVASLRERRELDVVLPDLLSELGYNVISRPSIGTRQFGVDVMAIGKENGEEKVLLFSIKQGDLNRQEWSVGEQSLRPSLEEIIDVYINTRIPPEYQYLKIVICLCFGGEVLEAVRDNITQFIKRNETDRIEFQIWNGDKLAGLLADGVLKEQLVSGKLRASFQKSVAMVDEPDISFIHFTSLIQGLTQNVPDTPKSRLSALRQIYICLWVLFVWSRDAGNLEAPYRASELAVLYAWKLINSDIGSSLKVSEEIGSTFSELVDLHFQIWDEYLGLKVLPLVDDLHAVSASVNTRTSLDVNLKLFEILGRLSQRGLWMLWSKSGDEVSPTFCVIEGLDEAKTLAGQVHALITNNPCLLAPIADEQSIDISLALLFLSMIEEFQSLAISYSTVLANNYWYTYSRHLNYPSIHRDYRLLVNHPAEKSETYRSKSTKASVLVPLIGVWSAVKGETDVTREFADFVNDQLKHCNLQFWLAGVDSEQHLYTSTAVHGWALTDVPVSSDGRSVLELLEGECARSAAYESLSAIRLGHWPIVAMACRHHRLPLPPNMWLPILREIKNKHLN
ncbi:chemotaxis protein [Pseudomonas syringae]|uniref:chemotaxis protein n=1 Tax=Pseudomonas syringae TaxID=317 RepID=UPI000CD36A29|nr:chemotaxis protein [Pseudomonas syringae]MCF5197827.1 chemotaxis protein [Pseudomonas syringae]MCF5211411.1 chemotaxis protein [Pseudomonas syringae]MCF5214881.1 chemotaxis protein [Pseudomonas syringae]MCF5217292.1 chemotaxis protein [Pseudomonas syringae]MCF5268431.1 chemotaxis protein [Pseudomonas syringae]